MSLAYLISIAALVCVLTLAAYVDRIYTEMGRFLAREYQENIDAWESVGRAEAAAVARGDCAVGVAAAAADGGGARAAVWVSPVSA